MCVCFALSAQAWIRAFAVLHTKKKYDHATNECMRHILIRHARHRYASIIRTNIIHRPLNTLPCPSTHVCALCVRAVYLLRAEPMHIVYELPVHYIYDVCKPSLHANHVQTRRKLKFVSFLTVVRNRAAMLVTDSSVFGAYNGPTQTICCPVKNTCQPFVCMYVCRYVHGYVNIHTYMCVCIYIYIYIYICTYIYWHCLDIQLKNDMRALRGKWHFRGMFASSESSIKTLQERVHIAQHVSRFPHM